ncbi:MAG: hypothetical protein QXM68_02320 [Candidatus Aenigmatarchaeota archaeon]|nr:hypothetical protein [Candidatus Aenigmarchaeota archaeon]
MRDLGDIVSKNPIKKIVKILYEEFKSGKVGISLSEISKKTGIERHKLSGMLEILSLIGLVAFLHIGMSKLVTPTENLLKMKYLLKKL